ncbi:hypothetical protein [Deinococcus cellulosilyticus]|uniref:Uncharacterized protein n=1 Tax=Deinococcus cellulosilyticus (strain DSM 18568 / NBRC 106333 / KACC 11606 / 5516J-15) TaxID=1223518 RepID=A0A511N780_DEIC1|nr:hypothetical protein [Deinococcus cellulosilyticus]GEM48703.1 hypothetical protein DC3_43380 [Deinococcus cellulosilyticus NBRC 106333 = KACC 11606]
MELSRTPIIANLPVMAKAESVGSRRRVYFETAREGVEDREGEDIAQQALWDSRDLLIEQGDFDINHFAHLGNPYGSGARPEYVIGHPTDVRRSGKSTFVQGEIFQSRSKAPEGSNGDWAEWFWHSITELDPPMKWFPSVFGNILEGKVIKRDGKLIRFITKVEWYSVGFARRVQNPVLREVQTAPLGPFAKAQDATVSYQQKHAAPAGVQCFTWGTLAKAMGSVGATVTDHAQITGYQSLTPESLEGAKYDGLKKRILNKVLRGKVAPKKAAIIKAFEEHGCSPDLAAEFAGRFLTEAATGK